MSHRRFIYALIALAAAAAGIGVAMTNGDGESAPVGAEYLSCDRTTGPEDDPAQFVASLEPGQTGCFRSGTHTAADTIEVSSPDVTLTSYPGESASLAGRLWVQEGADRATIENLTLDGRNEAALPSPTVNANSAVFEGNDISNDHTAICFVIGDDRYGEADRTVIERNRIHDCGELPETNHQHGIYVAHATNTIIRDNVVYGNADRGIQLYPDADRSLITGNVIDQNGQGVIFGGNESLASDDNVVEGNVITNSTVRYNVESSWPGPVGSGNVLRDNCLWVVSDEYAGGPAGSGIEPDLSGVELLDNTIAEPAYDEQNPDEPYFDGDGVCADVAAAVLG